MPLGFGFRFGLGGGGSAASSIKWLLPFNLGLSATIGADAVTSVTSETGDVFDATSGTVSFISPDGTPFVEGMRVSFDPEEGATLGSELVTNGDFATDTVWAKGAGWTISNGKAHDTSSNTLSQLGVVPAGDGATYLVGYEITDYTSGGISARLGTGGHHVTNNAVGVYSETILNITSSTNTSIFFDAQPGGSSFVGSIDNVSVKKITPVFLNSVSKADATKLTPSKTGSDGNEIMLLFSAWSNGATVPAGGHLTDFDGVQNKYYSSILGGVTSGTGVADDSGVTDWVEEGNYNNKGGDWLTHVMATDPTDFTSPQVITEQFLRVRVADVATQTYLSDGTNILAYDSGTTTLTFTDGVTTLTYVGALTVGDTIFIDQVDGKLYVEEDLKDTDGALDPLPWGAITSIGNVPDIYESSDLDPTDATWDE